MADKSMFVPDVVTNLMPACSQPRSFSFMGLLLNKYTLTIALVLAVCGAGYFFYKYFFGRPSACAMMPPPQLADRKRKREGEETSAASPPKASKREESEAAPAPPPVSSKQRTIDGLIRHSMGG